MQARGRESNSGPLFIWLPRFKSGHCVKVFPIYLALLGEIGRSERLGPRIVDRITDETLTGNNHWPRDYWGVGTMSGFLRRILMSFTARARTKQSARNRTRRMLRVEALEGRSLMAMDLAVISGIAFVDVNSNTTFDSGTDTVVGGATVELFRDTNSNGTFESGTDTLVGTTTTNATTGVYSFASTNAGGTLAANTLTAGGYFVRQLATTAFSPPSTPSLVTITSNDRLGTTIRSIDPFNVTAQTVQANAGTPTATSSVAATEVVGGERDIRATFTSGLANLDVAVVPGSSLFTFSSGANVIGTALVQYDGVDGNATALNATGLGGVSLNSNNALAGFQISTRGTRVSSCFNPCLYGRPLTFLQLR